MIVSNHIRKEETMKTTAYRTKEYILKDLLAKHYRTIDNLNDIANKCLENIEKNK
jgi:hypothetical protein